MMREQGISRRLFLEAGTISVGAMTLGVRHVVADEPSLPQDPAAGACCCSRAKWQPPQWKEAQSAIFQGTEEGSGQHAGRETRK